MQPDSWYRYHMYTMMASPCNITHVNVYCGQLGESLCNSKDVQSDDTRGLRLCCRYLLAQSADTLYVAFMGTKQFRDILTNADARLVQLWPNQVTQITLFLAEISHMH